MEITNELAQALLNYLVQKPYGETYILIGELQKQEQAQVKVEEPKKEEKASEEGPKKA